MTIPYRIDKILHSFPKVRTDLPVEYKKIYEIEYKENRDGNGIVGRVKSKLEGWMHHKVASIPKQSILEVGAGTLNHIRYEKNYKTYDIVEPMPFLYENSEQINNVNNVYETILDLRDKKSYSNIISIAVFEHMTDLPLELMRLVKSLDENGTLQVAIPSEGSFLWYIAWRFITGTSFYIRHRLNYKTFMKHEHVNNCGEIEVLIKYLFDDVAVSRFPFNLFQFSFYTYIEARKININALHYMEVFYAKNHGS